MPMYYRPVILKRFPCVFWANGKTTANSRLALSSQTSCRESDIGHDAIVPAWDTLSLLQLLCPSLSLSFRATCYSAAVCCGPALSESSSKDHVMPCYSHLCLSGSSLKWSLGRCNLHFPDLFALNRHFTDLNWSELGLAKETAKMFCQYSHFSTLYEDILFTMLDMFMPVHLISWSILWFFTRVECMQHTWHKFHHRHGKCALYMCRQFCPVSALFPSKSFEQ